MYLENNGLVLPCAQKKLVKSYRGSNIHKILEESIKVLQLDTLVLGQEAIGYDCMLLHVHVVAQERVVSARMCIYIDSYASIRLLFCNAG